MNNNPNNTPEKQPISAEQPELSTLSAPPERKEKKRKGSLLKKQLKTLIAIGAAIIVLAVGVGLAFFLLEDGDGIVDTFTESKTDVQNGKVTYTYHSRADEKGFIITDATGNTLKSYYVDENGDPVEAPTESSMLVFETAIGSLLKLSNDGKISYYALVDYGGTYVGGDTDCRVLIFPNVDEAQMSKITIFNRSGEDGQPVKFDIIGLDTDGDGETDQLQIDGYEKSTLNQLMASSLCSMAGYTLTLKKLSIDFMESYDLEHAGEDGYTPLLDKDKNIRFSEYGLDEESAAYYEITTRSGEKHRVYIGDKTPNGGGFYVRYYNETEGDRQAVYRLSDNSNLSNMFDVDISRTSLFLSSPEHLVYPQINYPVSMTTYLMPESFKSYFRNPDGSYRKVIDFSYIDIDTRKFTQTSTQPYILNDKSVLSGYMINSDKVNEALQDLYNISTLMSSDYASIPAKDYVTVEKLVGNVMGGAQLRPTPSNFSTAQKYSEAFDKYAESVEASVSKAVAENEDLYQLLAKYGLAEPAYKFNYYSTVFASSSMRLPIEFNCIWVSELTEKNTYYVWAPMYQQIVEISYNYLNFLSWDSFDWVSDKLLHLSVNFLDSIRVTGKDITGDLKDLLFEVDSSYSLSWKTGFVSGYKAPFNSMIDSTDFNVAAILGYDGQKTLSLSAAVKYTYQAKNSETGEITDQSRTLSAKLISNMDLAVVKTYCKWLCSSDPNAFFESQSSEMQQSLNAYMQSKPTVRRNETTVYLVHTVSDSETVANEKHYIEAKNYTVTIIYDLASDSLKITAGQQGQAAPLVYDERVFDDYFILKVKNNSADAKDRLNTITEQDIANVANLHSSVTAFSSTQNRLCVTIYDNAGKVVSTNEYMYDENNKEAEGSRYIQAFKSFYMTILYSTYGGYATEAETVGGAVLTYEQMEAYQAKGDDCDLKIDVRLCVDDTKYIYRMYNYSSSKSYITVEGNETDGGEGIFYILRNRTDKFLSDAVRASKGDTSIKSDGAY